MIGKKIGGYLYIHKSAVNTLGATEQAMLNRALELVDENVKYEIIKIGVKGNTVSLIQSPDWDEAREPIVADALNINLSTGIQKIIKQKNNPQIYHHKWMFVNTDYAGFDIIEEKAWSKLWQETIPKGHSSRIGYKSYWDSLVAEYNL